MTYAQRITRLEQLRCLRAAREKVLYPWDWRLANIDFAIMRLQEKLDDGAVTGYAQLSEIGYGSFGPM